MSSDGTKPIRVLLAGFHEVMRAGLYGFVSTRNMEIVGESQTVAGAVAIAAHLKPDVVLMEMQLPDGSGLDACRKILVEDPQIHVLFLTSLDDNDAKIASIFAGADGYLLHSIGSAALLDAIENAAAGASNLEPLIIPPLLPKVRQQPMQAAREIGLSRQEHRILLLVAEGKTNKEIGEVLGLSGKTVKNYLSNVYQKLNVSRRSQAAVWFTQIISQ
jgi:DNA-binding NarL/FixJ family response regulator